MLSKKIKICFFSGSRSEFGIISNIVKEAQKRKKFHTNLILSGSHLKSNYGNSVKEVNSENIRKVIRIKLTKFSPMNLQYYPNSISETILKLSKKLKKLKPDFLFVHGDRFETLAAAIASSSMNIPTVQLESGDITNGGTYDDSARHAISRLSHVLFTTNQESKKRLIKFGEENYQRLL